MNYFPCFHGHQMAYNNPIKLSGYRSLSPYPLYNCYWLGCTKVHPANRMMYACGQAGGSLLIGYIHCVINSFHISRLAFFKICTLKMCMRLFGSVWTFFKKKYGHIEDVHVHVTFWKCLDIFRKHYILLNLVICPACFA
jgi:hypothetical protein